MAARNFRCLHAQPETGGGQTQANEALANEALANDGEELRDRVAARLRCAGRLACSQAVPCSDDAMVLLRRVLRPSRLLPKHPGRTY